MHLILEYLPLIIFFIVYKFGDLYWATGSLIIASALQILYYWFKKEPIPKKNWVLFGLIAVFGGLTIYFQNDAFIKWKVTIIYSLFAAVLLISDYLFKKNLIKELMGEALELPAKIWQNLNLAWAMFFTLCAILNIYVAYNFSLETWVNFKVFGLMVLMFAFSIISIVCLYKYLPEDTEANTEDPKNNQ